MAISKKHQTVGQRYQIGDRVYRTQHLGRGKGKDLGRYGTITIDSSTNAVGAINITTWSNGKDQTTVLLKHIQHRLLKLNQFLLTYKYIS